MFSYSRIARISTVLLVLSAFATLGLHAQGSSSQADPQSGTTQTPAPPPTPASGPSAGSLSVQARIKARREARRVAAIHDVYSHLYEVYIGTGYMRFFPGNGAIPGLGLQRATEYSWNVGVTRYYNQRFGVAIDGRGTYGSAYIGPNDYTQSAITKPAISQYAVLGGPTYRLLLHPRYSVSARVMGGFEQGNFSGDLGSYKPSGLGLWPNSSTFAISASVPIEYNVSPAIGLRIAPEYYVTGFGSTIQNNRGVTGGIVYRFGKQ
jgi:hypothetical protein